MCKFYAHGYECSFERRTGNCRQKHISQVRDAHNYMRDCKANDVEVDDKVTTEILSKGWEDNM